MWKTWKKEIIGISAAALAGICIIVVFTLRMNEGAYKDAIYKPHLMVEDTVYWLSAGSYPASILPEEVVVQSSVGRTSRSPGQLTVSPVEEKCLGLNVTETFSNS